MFETLNDRGLKISQSDLVKNYLLGESGPRLGEAQEKWTLMRGALESLEEEDITVTFATDQSGEHGERLRRDLQPRTRELERISRPDSAIHPNVKPLRH